MRWFGGLLSAAALLGFGVSVSTAARSAGADTTTAETTTTAFVVAVRVVSVTNFDGIFQVVLACPGSSTCQGTYGLPAYDPTNTAFTIAPGKQWTHKQDIAGPLKTKARSAKTIDVVLVQTAADGSHASADLTVPLVQKPATIGPGAGQGAPKQDNGEGPTIAPGPASTTEVVRDPRGDNRSSFPLPIVYDIIRASATRRGNSVVFSITTVQPMTMRNQDGLITPCIEIPANSANIYPLFTFGSGHIPIGHGRVDTIPVHVSGTTVRWTVPHKYLYKLGFLWRATGGCDASHLADLAPNKGFETFRWVTVGNTG